MLHINLNVHINNTYYQVNNDHGCPVNHESPSNWLATSEQLQANNHGDSLTVVTQPPHPLLDIE